MQNHYEINVSLHGRHFFATHPRSCTTWAKAEQVYLELRERFPESEGYYLTVTHWKASGHHVNFDEE